MHINNLEMSQLAIITCHAFKNCVKLHFHQNLSPHYKKTSKHHHDFIDVLCCEKNIVKNSKMFIDHGTTLSCCKIPIETLVMLMAFWKKHCPQYSNPYNSKAYGTPIFFMDLKSFNAFCLCFFIPVQMHHINLLVQGEKIINFMA